MATSPDDLTARHRREATAAALLLLGHTRARYSLPSLVRQQGIRPRRFGRIIPTQALAGTIAAPHLSIAAAWAAERDHLLASYSSASAISRQVDASAARIAQTVAGAKQRFAPALRNIEQWHRGQWVQRVKSSTGLDVGMFTSESDVRPVIDDTVAWNQQIAEDVNGQAKHRIATGMMVALAAGAPLIVAQQAIDDAVIRAKRRAAAIGDDQTDKASRGMDRSRRAAASVDQFMWLHTPQKHPRDWHLARNGKVFGDDDIDSGDRAGVPPFCKCYEVPVFG